MNKILVSILLLALIQQSFQANCGAACAVDQYCKTTASTPECTACPTGKYAAADAAAAAEATEAAQTKCTAPSNWDSQCAALTTKCTANQYCSIKATRAASSGVECKDCTGGKTNAAGDATASVAEDCTSSSFLTISFAVLAIILSIVV